MKKLHSTLNIIFTFCILVVNFQIQHIKAGYDELKELHVFREFVHGAYKLILYKSKTDKDALLGDIQHSEDKSERYLRQYTPKDGKYHHYKEISGLSGTESPLIELVNYQDLPNDFVGHVANDISNALNLQFDAAFDMGELLLLSFKNKVENNYVKGRSAATIPGTRLLFGNFRKRLSSIVDPQRSTGNSNL